MKTKNILSLIAVAFILTGVKAQGNLYEKAGIIQIKDQKAIMSGSDREDKDLFKITLEDVGIYTGHICGCDAAGFIISKNILEMLFPGQIPNRGSVKVSISEYNMDLIDAITYITGTRLDRGKYTNSESDFIVDPSLAGNEGTTTLLFERKDNGKKVKVIIDRMVLLTKDEMYAASVIKSKIMKGEATEDEKGIFAKSTQDIVRKEILNLPEGSFSYFILN